MRVLIAAPDRDFLTCYQKLFEMEGYETVAAFDGYQVMSLLQEKKFGFVILDRSLPRVPHDNLIRLINEMKVAVIVLQTIRMDARLLLNENLANAYLRYPFKPTELLSMMNEILRKQQSGQEYLIGDVRLNQGAFLLEDRLRVTNEEINILNHLADIQRNGQKSWNENNDIMVENGAGESIDLPVKHGLYYVNALNQKLEKLQKKVRIQYEINKGYGLVNAYE